MTDEWYGSGQVAFSDDGKYLMLSSARDFKPTFSEEEFENIDLVDMQRVYLVTLAKDTESPLGPRSDEVGKAEKKEKEKERRGRREKKEEKKMRPDLRYLQDVRKTKKPVTVKVDTDGIQNRIVGLEITPANYRDLRLVDDRDLLPPPDRRATPAEDEDETDERSRNGISASTVWRIGRRRSWAT